MAIITVTQKITMDTRQVVEMLKQSGIEQTEENLISWDGHTQYIDSVNNPKFLEAMLAGARAFTNTNTPTVLNPEPKLPSQQPLCPNCGEVGLQLHTCPYKEDINNDSRTRCTCCSNCSNNCRNDI